MAHGMIMAIRRLFPPAFIPLTIKMIPGTISDGKRADNVKENMITPILCFREDLFLILFGFADCFNHADVFLTSVPGYESSKDKEYGR